MRRRCARTLSISLAAALALPAPAFGALDVDTPPSDAAMSVPAADPRPEDRAGSRGAWSIGRTGADSYRISWSSPERLPVTDARPEIMLHGRPLGTATTAADGRTVTVRVVTDRQPTAGELDVVLSGEVLDGANDPVPPEPTEPYTASRPRAPLGEDPGRPGGLAVTAHDYRLPGIAMPRMAAKVEVTGHVVRPADGQLTGRAPLVVFLHGRHDFCYDPGNPSRFAVRWPCRKGMRPVPSHLGYDYVQRLLAGQGYVTVSISANGINAQDFAEADGGAAARGRLVRHHLRSWAGWVAEGRYPVDLRNIVLVGHSRGGDGVNRVALETPLRAAYRITGQVLLAPTNFGRQTAAYVPSVTLLPYCDGDVVDLQGQAYTDAGRDLTVDDTALRSTVLLMGANHNFFNTEWTPSTSVSGVAVDDFGGGPNETCGARTAARLTAAEQRAAAGAYIAGAVALLARGDTAVLPMFDGSAVRVRSAGDADVRTHALGGGRVLRRPGIDAFAGSARGATTQICRGVVLTSRPRACGRDVLDVKAPHWVAPTPPGIPATSAFEMAWRRPGQRGRLDFSQPLDLSAAGSLDLRTVVDPRLGDVRLGVRLTDTTGAVAEVEAAGAGRVPALPRGRQSYLGKHLAQTLRVPLHGSTGLDLRRIGGLELVGRTDDGRVWVLDVAAVPRSAGLPPVPDRRLPVVDLGAVRVQEGDRPGESVAQLPFRLSSPATGPARFAVTTQSQYDGRALPGSVVDVAAGQTSGVIRFSYRANRIDDLRLRGFGLTSYPVRGVMTGDNFGRVVIVDDDPRPRLRILRTARRTEEGEALGWTLRLSRPVGYDLFADFRAVARRDAAPYLSTTDLRPAYLRRTGLRAGSSTPLHRAGLWVYRNLRAGSRSVAVSVPTRPDRVREGRESLTVRIRVPQFGRHVFRTGYVTDPN